MVLYPKEIEQTVLERQIMIFGKLFSPGADKPRKKAMLASLENLRDHRREPNLMIVKVKILKEGCPQINQKTEGKSPKIQVRIFKRNIMMKLKACIATTMKTRYQRKNSVQNSGAPEWARAMM